MSNYVLDPNKFHLSKVIRIVALAIKFSNLLKNSKINKARRKTKGLETATYKEIQAISEKVIDLAEDYYFQKASLEVRYFVKETKSTELSKEKDGKLLYTGRILPTNSTSITSSMTNTMQDLSAATFCVRIVDKYSPLAYAIINGIHWNDKVAQHYGVETVRKSVLKKLILLKVAPLSKTSKDYVKGADTSKRKLLAEYNLNTAPAFYITQVDLTATFKAYSKHNKRTTLKIWLVVFCCATTTTINIKVMEDYSTTAFIQAFTRLSCEVGYSK